MTSTRRATLVRPSSNKSWSPISKGNKKAPASSTGSLILPALDKLPTNEFLEKYLEDEDDEEKHYLSITSKTQHTIKHNPTPISSKSSDGRRSVLSATLVKSHRKPGSRLQSARIDLKEDDIETVLDVTEKFPYYDDTGQKAYEAACNKYGASPSARLHRKLAQDSVIDMSHYRIGGKGAVALAIPMVINTRVTSLNLRDNNLKQRGIKWIGKMMVENSYITDLDLSENNLGAYGAKIISEVFQENHRIKSIDLSANGFTDADINLLTKSIEEHPNLRTLRLANNHFGQTSGKMFKSLLSENIILQELDLSWNQIRSKGAVDLAKGLQENATLKVLNLAWNGFADQGVKAIAESLKSCSLVRLDLTSNRIGPEGFLSLFRNLKHNDTLRVLKLSKNPVNEGAASAAMELLVNMEILNLHQLELADMTYGQKFKDKLAEVKSRHGEFSCIHGYMDSYGKRRLKQLSMVEEALKAMQTYCDENNINIVELFSRFDADGNMSVTHEEFKQGLKEAKIPITDLQIEELIRSLDQDGDGEIDFSEMVLGAEMYKIEEEK